MRVHVSILDGSKQLVKRAMLATAGITMITDPDQLTKKLAKGLTDTTFQGLLLGRHSPINQYKIWVDIVAPERVHTHLVRHHKIEPYVATSRPDISYFIPLENGERVFSLVIDAKRLIEISWIRRCTRAWKDTRAVFDKIEELLVAMEPAFAQFLKPSCVWFGMCPEPKLDNKCLYYKTPKAQRERLDILKLSRGEVMHYTISESDYLIKMRKHKNIRGVECAESDDDFEARIKVMKEAESRGCTCNDWPALEKCNACKTKCSCGEESAIRCGMCDM